MRTETTGPDDTTANESGERRRKGRLWVPLVWAAVLPLLLVVLGASFASYPLSVMVGRGVLRLVG